jgi:hypothetical protein
MCWISLQGQFLPPLQSRFRDLSRHYPLGTGSLSASEIFGVLGCYEAEIGSYLPMLRVNLSVPSSRVKQSWPLEGGTETLSLNASNYKSTLRNIPEEQRSHSRGGGSLDSHLPAAFLYLSVPAES